jgi:hypothetical protein
MKLLVLIALLCPLVNLGVNASVQEQNKAAKYILDYEPMEVRAGSIFDIGLLSSIPESDSLKEVSFLGLKVELEGPVKLKRKLNKLKLEVLHQSKKKNQDPFITLHLFDTEGQAVYTHYIPVIYDRDYQIYYRAKEGQKGKRIPVEYLCQIQHDHEIMLHDSDYCHYEYIIDERVHGQEGGEGIPLEVYVQMVPNGERSKLLEIAVVNPETKQKDVRYLSPNAGTITIETAGGNGGDAMTCIKNGGYVPYSYSNPSGNVITEDIESNGGAGGDGGKITVYITAEARMFYHQIYLNNPGGEGGKASNACMRGEDGSRGQTGDIVILEWNPKNVVTN